jgi:hypothetical protein
MTRARACRFLLRRLSGALLLVGACGDSGDTGGAPSAGGQGGAGGEGGAPTVDGGAGGGGDGGGPVCTVLSTGDVRFLFDAVYELDPPNFGGPELDAMRLELFPAPGQPLTGIQDLSANGNDNYGTCTTCLVAGEDLLEGFPKRYFFAAAGTVDLGAVTADGMTSVPITDGFIDATLVEVTVDLDTFASTKVPDGACLQITGPIAMPPVPRGWTCEASTYADQSTCDCKCGLVDPDCAERTLPTPACFPGQTCSAAAECEGIPSGWTCEPSQYDGGAGSGCHCLCGAPDPDCELAGETVIGCAPGQECPIGLCFTP